MPSTMPHSRPVSISFISAVSRKNCMGLASLRERFRGRRARPRRRSQSIPSRPEAYPSVDGLVGTAVVEGLQLAGVLGRLQLQLGRRRTAIVLGELELGLLVLFSELRNGDDA